MRRQVSPSSVCRDKAVAYWQNVGGVRETLGGKSLHTLPVLKGKFFNHPKVKASLIPSTVKRTAPGQTAIGFLDAEAEPLKDEPMTATVLEEIYPRLPSPDSHSRPSATSLMSTPLSPTADGVAQSTRDGGKTLAFAPLQEKVAPTSPPNKDKFRQRASTQPQQQQPPRGTLGPQGGLQPPQEQRPLSTERPALAHSKTQQPDSIRLEALGLDRHDDSAERQWSKETTAAAATAAAEAAARAHRMGDNSRSVTLTTLHALRLQIKERFGTVAEAFERFAEDMNLNRPPNRKEWLRLLVKHGFDWFTKARMDSVFDQLDMDKDGYVSVTELRIAIEATAPVRTTAGLRRRWLAFGFPSMLQAAAKMDDNGLESRKRLSLKEFGARLCRVAVYEPSEHWALFEILRAGRGGDPGSDTVSIAELLSAVAVVSPQLLLEDLRDRLRRKYNRDLGAAFSDLDVHRNRILDEDSFAARAVAMLSLSEPVARKAFRAIDVDNSGGISRKEFLASLNLCSPSLKLEDMRVEVCRRFWSMQQAFSAAFEDALLLDEEASLSLVRFQNLLEHVDMKDADSRALFECFDTDQDGDLSVGEFWKGVQHFAPACTLEHMRMRCLQKHGSVTSTFANVEDWTQPLAFDGFRHAVNEIGLVARDRDKVDRKLSQVRLLAVSLGEDASSTTAASFEAIGQRLENIFELLDTKNSGTTTVAELHVALQACGAGSNLRLSPEERDARAMQEVRGDVAPIHMLCNNLKAQVRYGLHWHEGRAGAVGAPRGEAGHPGQQGRAPSPTTTPCCQRGGTTTATARLAGWSRAAPPPSCACAPRRRSRASTSWSRAATSTWAGGRPPRGPRCPAYSRAGATCGRACRTATTKRTW